MYSCGKNVLRKIQKNIPRIQLTFYSNISLVPSCSGDFQVGFIGVLKMSAGSPPDYLVQFVEGTPHA